ncbi:MAG: beta-ketoacyl synthase, partial [Pseudomonadales bacterium]|nr:beta-ketoacyl synthase [Pseudomonadales bacterium]
MSRLPVIVGFGGVNPAGRSSAHQAYRRLVIDKLNPQLADDTLSSLATMMQLSGKTGPEKRQYILDHTLVRKLEDTLFDPQAIPINKSARLSATSSGPISFQVRRNQLPDNIPPTWKIEQVEDAQVMVTVGNDLEIMFPDTRSSRVNSAGQLPTGFEPEKLYQSRNHPRGLQLTVYGASDAINSLGIDWEKVRSLIPGDQISVYASSAMGQLDMNGSGGMLQAALMGKRVSSKNCALGLAEMTADFINAYILGSVGCTGANIGACATFLYNLRQGIQDIRSGKFRAVIVGASEAPLTPEVIEGYRTMGALAEDEALKKLDHIVDGNADHRRACRPFSDNCGFTVAEG